MRYLHTLDPDDLREINDNDDLTRALELMKEDEVMERYYERKEQQ